jgi:CelD/BcsL family acetyltransferase involved in cellulose biosynthesis
VLIRQSFHLSGSSTVLRKRFEDERRNAYSGVRMTVELLEDKKRWDQFVETSPQGLLFHKWDFLKTVERHSKYQFLPYCVYSGDQPVCIFPFFIGRGPLRMTHMLSPAWNAQIPYLGPAFDPSVQARRASAKDTILDQVTDELCREIDKIAPNFVSITTAPNSLDVRFFIWRKYREHLNFTCTIDLERSLDEIWASTSKSCRRDIRKLSAYSPEIQQTNDFSPLLDIWRKRFSELAMQVPLLSDSYLKELVATFPQDVTVYNLIIDGRLAAAGSCCVMQKQLYCAWIGGVNARKGLSGVDYLTWEIIQQAKSQGFKKLDLGQTDARLSRFKSKFDPVIEPFWTLEKADTPYKIRAFAYNKLSGAKKLASDAISRALS